LPEGDPGSAIFTVDTRGRVLTWSPGAQRTKGYRPEEIVGRNCACFYMRNEIALGLPQHHLRKAAAEGHFSSEGWRVRKDGTRFWASVVIIPLREANGSLRGFSQIAREVTGRALSRTALDSLRERICVLDRDGSIVLTNQAWDLFAQTEGAEADRCGIGVNYLRVCRTATGLFSERAFQAASGIESVLRGTAPHFTLDYPCPSSSQRGWFRLTARPLRQPHTGAVILHSEITSQVLLAEKLRRAQAHYGALLENPVDVVTVLAADGNIRRQSPASEGVLGIRPEEMVGQPIFEFVHPDDSDAVRKLLRDCLRDTNGKHPCEYRFRNKDGSWRMLESIARKLLSNPEGGIILNSRDITHRKLAEETLLAEQDALVRHCGELEALAARLFRKQEEERRRVAAELNGNLSQRVASMSLQAAHMASHAAAPGQSQGLQECVASLDRDLRHLAGALYPATLDHLGLAVALREYCAEFTRKQGIPVIYVHRGISGRLSGHTAATLYRIGEEALANVAKHAHANQAWVTLSRTAKGTRLAVRDDGAGFDPAAVEPGWGLGILAMRERLRAVKGSLSIRSRPGNGAEIVALVPINDCRLKPNAT
jgi:PAS domain S-box-containing protein